MRNGTDYFEKYAVVGFCVGITLFFSGFKRLRRKRLIENIPTSTVRGLAMGLLELSGKVEKTILFKSPFTKTECVLYKYLIYEYKRIGLRRGERVTVASGNSFHCPFWLNDETGKIMVYSQGVELFLSVNYEFNQGILNGIPDNLIEFMKENGIRYEGLLCNRNLYFQEWVIKPGENVYVMGSAKKLDTNADHKNGLMQRIKELKENSQKLKEVDLNKDGEISMEEWDLAVTKLEQKVLEETLKNAQVENPTDVIIGKGNAETMFMISDQSEKKLIETLSDNSVLSIYGGATLSLVTLIYLLVKFGF